VTDIAVIARAAEDAGADALTVANTYQGMSVDTRTRKSRVGRATGGLSGPAIRPITLRLVYEASRAVKIPIVGLGGIEITNDILEYLIVGARAVQIGTANFADPGACETLVGCLEKAFHMYNIHKISELVGTLNVDNA
jgi:dihydroorotate dehydrogenase (NAD+) catalytic subunit